MFVICLDEVPPDEALDRLLAAIRSRLANEPEEEREVAAEELRRLARGRLVYALRDAKNPTTSQNGATPGQ
ncbi:hypothetical protein GCM10010254_59070 [Streptomyces chromofuscus]|nr:hypothetical protein GCM10010254_59070 [Streptomyces chromofuscus]